MATGFLGRTGEPSSIVALEAVLKSRFGWADGVISPFARAAHNRLAFDHRPRRRLSIRAKGNDLRGGRAHRK